MREHAQSDRCVGADVRAGLPPALAQPFEERLAACLACHGEKGVSETREVPSLAGMPEKFTLIQLYLFRERMRKIEIMNDVAKGMTDDDLRKFSDYFAKLAPPKASGDPPDPAIAARAQAVIAKNHCASCHNPDFSGREQMPRLAAQREDYLLKSLRDYKAAQAARLRRHDGRGDPAHHRCRHRRSVALSGAAALSKARSSS